MSAVAKVRKRVLLVVPLAAVAHFLASALLSLATVFGPENNPLERVCAVLFFPFVTWTLEQPPDSWYLAGLMGWVWFGLNAVIWGVGAYAIVAIGIRTGRLRRVLVVGAAGFTLAIAAFVLWVLSARVADKRDWHELEARTALLRPGMTEQEVIERVGEPSSRQERLRRDGREDVHWIQYETQRRVLPEGIVTVRFQDELMTDVDVVPEFQIAFRSEDWKAASAGRRWCMRDDLLARQDLVDLDREGILGLLGPPESGHFEAENQLWYHLGGRYMDDEWLVIVLHADGRVADVRIEWR